MKLSDPLKGVFCGDFIFFRLGLNDIPAYIGVRIPPF